MDTGSEGGEYVFFLKQDDPGDKKDSLRRRLLDLRKQEVAAQAEKNQLAKEEAAKQAEVADLEKRVKEMEAKLKIDPADKKSITTSSKSWK
jgi:ATPase subunit of ABC transporter with duplicated ATPase domains